MEETRNIWCTSILPVITDEGFAEDIRKKYRVETNGEGILPFTFEEVQARFLEEGEIRYGEGNRIKVFKILDREEYVSYSKWMIQEVLGDFK